MAYEPTEWKSKDVITSAKLNKLEQGVANSGGAFVINVDPVTYTMDKTWQEIHDALETKSVEAIIHIGETDILAFLVLGSSYNEDYGGYLVQCCAFESDDYITYEIVGSLFTTETSDGYPRMLQS